MEAMQAAPERRGPRMMEVQTTIYLRIGVELRDEVIRLSAGFAPDRQVTTFTSQFLQLGVLQLL